MERPHREKPLNVLIANDTILHGATLLAYGTLYPLVVFSTTQASITIKLELTLSPAYDRSKISILIVTSNPD